MSRTVRQLDAARDNARLRWVEAHRAELALVLTAQALQCDALRCEEAWREAARCFSAAASIAADLGRPSAECWELGELGREAERRSMSVPLPMRSAVGR